MFGDVAGEEHAAASSVDEEDRCSTPLGSDRYERSIGRPALAGSDARSQHLDRGGFEQDRRRKVVVETVRHDGEHLERLDGGAPEFEEVVGHTDSGQAKATLPNRNEISLDSVGRGCCRPVRHGFHRFRERGPVDLPAGGEGHLVEHNEMRRDRVGGQMIGQVSAQFGRFRCRTRARDGAPNDVSGENRLFAFGCPGEGDGLGYPGVAEEHLLDLEEIDTVAVDLDPLVLTAEMFQISVRRDAAEVSSPVDATAVGARSERGGRQFRLVPVSVGDVVRLEVHLPDRPRSDFGPVIVDHQNLAAGRGEPDRNHRFRDFIPGLDDEPGDRPALRRSEAVDEGRCFREVASGQFDILVDDAVAPDYDVSDRREHDIFRLRFEEAAEERRYEQQTGDPLVLDPPGEALDPRSDGIVQAEGRTTEQRPERVTRGRREAEGEGLGEAIGRGEVQEFDVGRGLLHEVAMRVDDPLGPTGRSRGVHDARRHRWIDGDAGVVGGFTFGDRGDVECRCLRGLERDRLIGDHGLDLGVFDKSLQSARRVGRVERYVGLPRLQDAEQRGHDVDVVVQDDGHPACTAPDRPQQRSCDPVGPRVEVTVGDPALDRTRGVGDRHGIRRPANLGLEELVNGPVMGGVRQHLSVAGFHRGIRNERSIRVLHAHPLTYTMALSSPLTRSRFYRTRSW